MIERTVLGIAALVTVCAITSPVFAGQYEVAKAFIDLCGNGDYKPLTANPPQGFPLATSIPADQLLQDIPASLKLSVVEGWDLLPGPPPKDRMAVVAATMDHPKWGASGVCIILAEGNDASLATDHLAILGATREGNFLFFAGRFHPWLISVGASYSDNVFIIVGISPNDLTQFE